MFQIGPREIGADLAFGVDLALFILQCKLLFLVLSFKPHANGRNIVGQQLPTLLLDVRSCFPLPAVYIHTCALLGLHLRGYSALITIEIPMTIQ